MTRLSIATRARIRDEVLRHQFQPRIVALEDETATLARELYNHAHRSRLKQMAEIPNGWLPEENCIRVSINNQVYGHYFNGQYSHRYGDRPATFRIRANREPVTLRLPKKFLGGVSATISQQHDLARANHNILVRQEVLDNEISDAERALAVTLDKFFTIKSLVEAWPDIEPFTRNLPGAPKPQLPAVPINTLNKMLGLPVEAKEDESK